MEAKLKLTADTLLDNLREEPFWTNSVLMNLTIGELRKLGARLNPRGTMSIYVKTKMVGFLCSRFPMSSTF